MRIPPPRRANPPSGKLSWADCFTLVSCIRWEPASAQASSLFDAVDLVPRSSPVGGLVGWLGWVPVVLLVLLLLAVPTTSLERNPSLGGSEGQLVAGFKENPRGLLMWMPHAASSSSPLTSPTNKGDVIGFAVVLGWAAIWMHGIRFVVVLVLLAQG